MEYQSPSLIGKSKMNTEEEYLSKRKMYCLSHTATLHLIIQSFSNKITRSKFSHLITEAYFYKFWSSNFIYGSYVSQHMSQIEGVMNHNLKTSNISKISQLIFLCDTSKWLYIHSPQCCALSFLATFLIRNLVQMQWV